MLGKWAKVILLLATMSGLCASAQPITTAASPAVADLASPFAGGVPPVRVALLLPLQSEIIGAAADAVRSGFLNAADRKHANLIVTVIDTSDNVADVLGSYRDASSKYDIIVGPLSRSAVSALLQSANVSRPTIALAQPDLPDGAQQRLPPQMLMMGLSVEDEARQVAAWVEREKTPGKIFAISTNIAWQRRAAKAFAAEARHIGLTVDELEFNISGNVLSASGLAQLSQRIQSEKPALLFVALDAAQTSQLRSAIGTEVALYGTSQLNPLTPAVAAKAVAALHAAAAAGNGEAAGNNAGTNASSDGGNGSNDGSRRPALDGVRLLDLPWQLRATSSMPAYPPLVSSDNRPNADLERLYALGIDAFRVVDELALQRTSFDLDGVTGQINVNMTPAATYFQRRETQAVYQDGIVVPLSDQR